MDINEGCFYTGVAQQSLDDAKIDTPLQKVGGVGMPQGMDRGFFIDAAFPQGVAEGALQAARGDWPLFTPRWKQPGLTAPLFPVVLQHIQNRLRQRDTAVFATLAVTDPDQHALGIDIVASHTGPFGKAKAAGIDQGQSHLLDRRTDPPQKRANSPGE